MQQPSNRKLRLHVQPKSMVNMFNPAHRDTTNPKVADKMNLGAMEKRHNLESMST